MLELENNIKSRDEWFALSQLKPESIKILNTLVAKDEVLLAIPISQFQKKLRHAIEKRISEKAQEKFEDGNARVTMTRQNALLSFEEKILMRKYTPDDASKLHKYYEGKLFSYLEQLSPLEIQTILGNIVDSFRNPTPTQGAQDRQTSILKRVTAATGTQQRPGLTSQGMASLGHQMDLQDQQEEQERMKRSGKTLWSQKALDTIK